MRTAKDCACSKSALLWAAEKGGTPMTRKLAAKFLAEIDWTTEEDEEFNRIEELAPYDTDFDRYKE